ncbi:MAG: mechanosensitive ion channel family protein [Gemmatimonadales bacterium]
MLALMLPDWLHQFAGILQTDAQDLIRRALKLAFILVAGWAALRLVGLIARRIEKAVDDGDDSTLTRLEKRGQTLAQLLRSVGRLVVLVITTLMILGLFVNIGPLLAGAGVVGLAVSFGAQSLVKDFLSGFFILFEDQFGVGDVVEINGKSGAVERMTLRIVQLRSLDGTVHTIPNGEIKAVSNLTRGWSRAVIEVGVAYDTDLDRALEVLRDVGRQLAADEAWRIQLDGEPEVLGVEGLGENALTLRIVARTRPGQQWAVARELRRRIKLRFDREDIEIPFPQRTMHVRVDGERKPGKPLAGLLGGEEGDA